MLAAPMACARSRSVVLLVAMALGGCAAKGSKAQDSATPTATTLPVEDEVEDDIDARARELDDYEAQLRALGLAPARDEPDGAGATDAEGEAEGEAATSKTEADRCARICDLAEAICAIETNVCRLASEHPGDARYADVCARAETDCELASSACKECSDG
jgi:hypothetical protein